MTHPQNDSQNTETTQSASDYLSDMAKDRAKEAAGNFVREQPKRMLRRMLWSFILSLTLHNDPNNLTRNRLLNRVERGEKLTLHEVLFGSRFSLFSFIRTIIFLVIVGAVIFYMWQQGLFDQIMAQQELINQIQGTSTP